MLVPTNINEDIVLSDSEQAAIDFCEDLRTLAEVSVIRGCHPKDMGQQMIGCGLQVLKEGCRDANHALQVAEAIMDEWEALHANK